MGSSPDVGGRYGLGKPQVPDAHEQQTTAQVFVAKQGLGIMPNTLEVPFTQLGDQAWKYKSPATKPLIAAKVLVAVVREDPKKEDPSETQLYKELTQDLPVDLNLQLKEENKKPPYQRNYRFLVLEQLLRFFAKALAHLDACQKLQPEDFSENSNKIRSRPFASLWAWIPIADNVILSLKSLYASFIDHPHYASILAYQLALLDEVKSSVQQLLKEDKVQEKLSLLNEKLSLLKERFENGQEEHPLLIAEDLLTLLHAITHSLARGECPHLLLGPHLIADTYRLNPATTSGLGKGFLAILNKITRSIKEIDNADALWIQHLCELLLFLFSSFVFQASGAPQMVAREGEKALVGEKERMQSFAYKLASCLIVTSNVLPTIGMEALKFTRLDPKAGQFLIEGITFIAMNIPIIAALEGSALIKESAPLISGMRLLLKEKLEYIKTIFENEEARDFAPIAIALKQALLSLQKEESAGYFEALATAATESELTLTALKEECEEITTFALLLLGTINAIHAQDVLTSVMSQRA